MMSVSKVTSIIKVCLGSLWSRLKKPWNYVCIFSKHPLDTLHPFFQSFCHDIFEKISLLASDFITLKAHKKEIHEGSNLIQNMIES